MKIYEWVPFLRIGQVNGIWFVCRKGYGFSENGWKIVRTGWKVHITRLRQHPESDDG